MSKKIKSKKTTIYMEKEVRAFAKKRAIDEEDALSMWKEILEDEEINEIEEEGERDMYRVKILKVNIKEKQMSTSPSKEITAVILGVEPEATWNEQQLKFVLDRYEKTGQIPQDDQNRPLIMMKNEAPVVLAYAKQSGQAYPLKIKKERKLILWGGPEDGEDEMVMITAGGKIKGEDDDGNDTWLVHELGDIPLGSKAKLKVRVGERGVWLANDPINNNGYFEVDDEDINIDEIFQEMDKDFIEFSDIEEYAESHPYTPFWSHGTVANIGQVTDYNSLPVAVMEEPSGLLTDDDEDSMTLWVPDELEVNYQKGDKIRFISRAWLKEDKLKMNISGIHPYNPRDIPEHEEVKKKAKNKRKKTSNKLNLFD